MIILDQHEASLEDRTENKRMPVMQSREKKCSNVALSTQKGREAQVIISRRTTSHLLFKIK